MKDSFKKIDPPYYPIVYVRGYAMRRADVEETFNDSYYGFATSAVYKKQTQADNGYLTPDLFEGQLIRFMKSRFESSDEKKYGYADAVNCRTEDFDESNPSRSIWISRFYDVDYIQDKVRSIENHALELTDLIVNKIPLQLLALGMSRESLEKDYKVILITHSMGGLVCRTLLQNTLPNYIDNRAPDDIIVPLSRITDPAKLIHRLVTIGSPHKGIDMGNIPDIVEEAIVSSLNPYDSSIFRPKRMREYLQLDDLKNPQSESRNEDNYKYDLHSLGKSTFPVKNCLCVIGSDYGAYSAIKHVTGSFSDGLVKQDRAYIVSGEKPVSGTQYDENNVAFYANVHRAHSGYRGIVNSYETFENIQRFLFGDLGVRIALRDIKIQTPELQGLEYFYDFEFALTIRGTGVYLHQRKQDPCENAIRIRRKEIPDQKDIFLHTGFLNSKLRQSKNEGSFFIMKFSVLEYSVKKGLLWDTQYPSRTIYSESLEIEVVADATSPYDYVARYSWQSDIDKWKDFAADEDGNFVIPLTTNAAVQDMSSLVGNIVLKPFKWGEQTT
ncbi:hypothetical protein [Mucilaginibacter sp. PAMB04168]|uniref:hypothetical protein n=1 Tax=Mucilaginibacter sp. PAMB04168 TaxID=3138567 RepID=UPI0031F6C3E0